jgi:O-antigen/teichoic acid export membrane protein
VAAQGPTAANAVYSGIDLYLEFATLLILSVVIARHLGPERFGTYTLIAWIIGISTIVANNGITTGAMKFIGEARGRGDPDLARGVFARLGRWQTISVALTCAAVVLFALMRSDAILSAPQAGLLIWIAVPAIAARAIYTFRLAAAKGFEDFRRIARIRAFVAPANLVLVISLTLAGAGLVGLVLAYAATSLLYAVAMWAGLRNSAGTGHASAPDAALVARMHRHVRFAGAIMLLDLAILRQTELIFLEVFSTQANIGFYALGRSLATSAMLVVPGVFAALLLPSMSRGFAEDPARMPERFLAATRHLVLLAVPVVALAEIYAGTVVLLLYGEAFLPAATVFRVTVAAAAVGAVSASASSYQLSSDRQPAILAIMVAVAIVTLMLDLVLISQFELAGAMAAGAFGSLALGLLLLWHACRTLGVRPEFGVYARALAAGVLASVPAVIMAVLLPWWLSIPLGGGVLVAGYAVLTVMLGAWRTQDLGLLRERATRLPGPLRRFALALVDAAAQRAVGGKIP